MAVKKKFACSLLVLLPVMVSIFLNNAYSSEHSGSSNVDGKKALSRLLILEKIFLDDAKAYKAGKLSINDLANRIASQFAPLINRERVALRVMGKYAKKATKSERLKFAKQLEKSLTDAYSRGVISYGGERLSLPDEAKIVKPGRALVTASVESLGRPPLSIQFALMHHKERGWLIENIAVSGVNVGLTLRQQFDFLVKKNGSINGAISNWSLTGLDQSQ